MYYMYMYVHSGDRSEKKTNLPVKTCLPEWSFRLQWSPLLVHISKVYCTFCSFELL